MLVSRGVCSYYSLCNYKGSYPRLLYKWEIVSIFYLISTEKMSQFTWYLLIRILTQRSILQDRSWWSIWSQGCRHQLRDWWRQTYASRYREILQHSHRRDAHERCRPHLKRQQLRQQPNVSSRKRERGGGKLNSFPLPLLSFRSWTKPRTKNKIWANLIIRIIIVPRQTKSKAKPTREFSLPRNFLRKNFK